MSAPTPRSILFVGNSFTHCTPDAAAGKTAANDLPGWLNSMAQSTHLPLDAKALAVDDETLQGHWANGALAALLQPGRWDGVVLQEHSQRPLLHKNLMFEYAQKLDALIKASGARTFLFSTWAWRDFPETQGPIDAAYADLGRKLGAPVVPVGQAWRAARENKIGLYLEDGVHPSPAGAYLSACVFFSFLLGINPVDYSEALYKPEGVPAAPLGFLERTAWETVRAARP